MRKNKLIFAICIFLGIILLITQSFAVTEKDNGVLKIYNANSQRYGLAFDIEGYNNGKLVQTTWGNNSKESGMSGYMTYMKVNDNAAQKYVSYTGDMTQNINGVELKVDVEYANEGKYAQIIYTVKNKNSSSSKISLGTCADVQIGDNDKATVERINNNKGLRLYSSSENLQFSFYGKSVSGTTDIDNLWIGEWKDNWYREEGYIENNIIFASNTNTKIENKDSSFAYSWKDRIISAGSTERYSVLIGVGEINYAPELEVTTINNEKFNTKSIILKGSIKDKDKGDTAVLHYTIDNGEEKKDSKTYAPNGETANFELDLTSEKLSLGKHTIKLWVIDSQGNPSDIISKDIIVIEENIKEDNEKDNNNIVNKTENAQPEDNTIIKNTNLPNAGIENSFFAILIILLIVLGIMGIFKYIKYKDIK